MTVVKIQGKPRAAAAGPIEQRADWLWDHPGGRVIGVVELVHTERSEPAPESDKDRTVTLAISTLELASAEQEETMRKAARALFLHRTAVGTLDPDGEVELSERTLNLLVGELHEREAVRLRAALTHWAEYARKVFLTPDLRESELRHELQAITDGLHAAAHMRADDE